VRTLTDQLAAIDVSVEAFGWPAEDEDDERARAAATLEAEREAHTSRFLAFDEERAVATGQAWAVATSQRISCARGPPISAGRTHFGRRQRLRTSAWRRG
jgi:hypothetical protein